MQLLLLRKLQPPLPSPLSVLLTTVFARLAHYKVKAVSICFRFYLLALGLHVRGLLLIELHQRLFFSQDFAGGDVHAISGWLSAGVVGVLKTSDFNRRTVGIDRPTVSTIASSSRPARIRGTHAASIVVPRAPLPRDLLVLPPVRAREEGGPLLAVVVRRRPVPAAVVTAFERVVVDVRLSCSKIFLNGMLRDLPPASYPFVILHTPPVLRLLQTVAIGRRLRIVLLHGRRLLRIMLRLHRRRLLRIHRRRLLLLLVLRRRRCVLLLLLHLHVLLLRMLQLCRLRAFLSL